MLTTNKLTLLHSIRGLAAFYVVVAHAKFPLWSGGQAYLKEFPRVEWGLSQYILFALDMLSSNGSAMVIIFYVLSGFFIAYSFDKNNWALSNFYINRILRIYIPYIFSMIFAIAVINFIGAAAPELIKVPLNTEFLSSLKQSHELLNIKSFILGLFFLPNEQYIGFNFPYWSLLYEGIFYIIAPFVIRYPKPFFYLSLGAILSSFFFNVDTANPLLRFAFDFSFYFALGIGTFHFIKETRTPAWLKRNYLVFGLLAFFPVFIIVGVAGYKKISFLMSGIFCSGLIYLFVNYPIKDFFLLKFFKKMGMISYSMYLFHFPILVFILSLIYLLTGKFFFYNRIYWIGVIVAVVLSFPIYYLVEEKSLRIIASIKKKRMPVVN